MGGCLTRYKNELIKLREVTGVTAKNQPLMERSVAQADNPRVSPPPGATSSNSILSFYGTNGSNTSIWSSTNKITDDTTNDEANQQQQHGNGDNGDDDDDYDGDVIETYVSRHI
jgi:hypothetical protein